MSARPFLCYNYYVKVRMYKYIHKLVGYCLATEDFKQITPVVMSGVGNHRLVQIIKES